MKFSVSSTGIKTGTETVTLAYLKGICISSGVCWLKDNSKRIWKWKSGIIQRRIVAVFRMCSPFNNHLSAVERPRFFWFKSLYSSRLPSLLLLWDREHLYIWTGAICWPPVNGTADSINGSRLCWFDLWSVTSSLTSAVSQGAERRD